MTTEPQPELENQLQQEQEANPDPSQGLSISQSTSLEQNTPPPQNDNDLNSFVMIHQRSQDDLAASPPDFHFMLLGDSSVGKSSFLWVSTHNQPCSKQILDKFRTQSYNFESKLSFPGITTSKIWHIRMTNIGASEVQTVRDSILTSANGFVFLFDLTNKSTIFEVIHYSRRIMRAQSKSLNDQGESPFPCILVGTKADIVASDPSQRQVTYLEAEMLAKTIGCPYFEVSHSDPSSVFSAVKRLCISTISHKRNQSAGNTSSNTPPSYEQQDSLLLASPRLRGKSSLSSSLSSPSPSKSPRELLSSKNPNYKNHYLPSFTPLSKSHGLEKAEIRICVVGSSCSGKSSLVLSFLSSEPQLATVPKLEETYRILLNLPNYDNHFRPLAKGRIESSLSQTLTAREVASRRVYTEHGIDITDVGSSTVRRKHMKRAHGFIIAVDVAEPASFENGKKIAQKIVSSSLSKNSPPILFAATKSDKISFNGEPKVKSSEILSNINKLKIFSNSLPCFSCVILCSITPSGSFGLDRLFSIAIDRTSLYLSFINAQKACIKKNPKVAQKYSQIQNLPDTLASPFTQFEYWIPNF